MFPRSPTISAKMRSRRNTRRPGSAPAGIAAKLARVLVSAVFRLLPAVLFLHPLPAPGADVFRVGVVSDMDPTHGPGGIAAAHIDRVFAEARALFGDEVRVVFQRMDPSESTPEDAMAHSGGRDSARVEAALERALADPEVEMVLCAGVLSTLAAADPGRRLSKPVLAAFHLDPDFFGLPLSEDGRSAKRNFAFIAAPGQIRDDLADFAALVPPGTPIHLVVDEILVAGIPDFSGRIADLARQSGLELRIAPAGSNAENLLAALPPEARAAYLAPLLHMDPGEWRAVVAGLEARNLFTYSLRGETDVRLGVLAGGLSDMEDRLARRTALQMKRIREGADPSDLPVRLPAARTLFLNLGTAAAIGWSPSFDVLLRAVLVDRPDRSAGGDPLTLAMAMEEAVRRNPGATVAESSVAAAREAAGMARAGLFPQISGEVQWRRIDRGRAEASLGMVPLERLDAGIGLEHAIFDDAIVSRYRKARRAFESAVLEGEAAIQDIMLEAGLRCLALLSAEALLRIERENLSLTQRNLRMARLRREIGVAGPEEILRFETLRAEVQSRVIQRESLARQALADLNRSLGRESAARWSPTPIDRETARTLFLGESFLALVGNLDELDRLADFSAELAMDRLRIRALGRMIEAQRIEVDRLKRRFHLPSVGGMARYERRLDEERLPPTLPPGLSDFLPESGRNEWTVGLKLSLPLFEGGLRVHELGRAEADLRRLKAELALLRRAAETEVRNQLSALYHSYPNIELRERSAETAREHLDVIREKYARGAVSILELLDAQTQAITQGQAASAALYAMVSDLLRYHRAIGWMGLVPSSEDREEFRRRLEAHFANRPPTGGSGGRLQPTEMDP